METSTDTKKRIRSKISFLQRGKRFHEAGILIALITICSIIGLVNPVFFSWDNIVNLLRQTSYVIIVTLMTTVVIIIGGLDLSVGSVMGLSGIATAIFLVNGIPIFIAIMMGMAAASIIGILNGLLIVRYSIPSLIVTIGTLYIGRGICNVLTKGVPVYPLPQKFEVLGNGHFISIPYSVYIALFLAVLAHFVLTKTTFGRSIYAIGGNKDTARLSGIHVNKIQILVYVLSSLSAALAGIIMTSRITSGQTSLGTGWEMTVIASAVIGGTSTLGGSGTVLGSVFGAMLMSVIENGMVLMNVSVYWQKIVIGAIIIIAVAIDLSQKKRAGLDVR